MYYILIDNGHGYNTPGKCSPDKTYFEWKFTRKIADLFYMESQLHGWNPILIVPESVDISLTQRVKRINEYCKIHGSSKCLFFSLHSNASQNGSWGTARGVSIWTTRGQNNSDKLAEEIWLAGEKILGKNHMRADLSDRDHDYESNFTVIKGANCPAVLIENFFHDNKEDLKLLNSLEWQDKLVKSYCAGIKSYISKYNN